MSRPFNLAKKVLVSSIPDYVNSEMFNHSLKAILENYGPKRFTASEIRVLLMLSQKEFQVLEVDVFDKLKRDLGDINDADGNS